MCFNKLHWVSGGLKGKIQLKILVVFTTKTAVWQTTNSTPPPSGLIAVKDSMGCFCMAFLTVLGFAIHKCILHPDNEADNLQQTNTVQQHYYNTLVHHPPSLPPF